MQNKESQSDDKVYFDQKEALLEKKEIMDSEGGISSEAKKSFEKGSGSALNELNQALSSQDLPEGITLVNPIDSINTGKKPKESVFVEDVLQEDSEKIKNEINKEEKINLEETLEKKQENLRAQEEVRKEDNLNKDFKFKKEEETETQFQPELKPEDKFSLEKAEEVKTEIKEEEQDLDEEVNTSFKKEELKKRAQEKIPRIAIRTFKSDLANIIKKNKISVDKVFLTEQKKGGYSSLFSLGEKGISPKTKKNLFFIFFSLFLVLAGIFSVFWVYYNKPVPWVKVDEVEVKAYVYSEYQREIFIDSESVIKLTNTIKTELKNSTLPLGSILHFYLTKENKNQKNIIGKRVLQTKELLSLLNSRVSENFLRYLENDFMYGFYSSMDIYPFLIFKIKSFDHSFPEMLAWEKNLVEDLRPLFVEENPAIPTTELRNSVFSFKDIVLNNLEARAVLDQEGKIVFVYSFVDEKTLVIATNKNILNEIVNRLRNSYREN